METRHVKIEYDSGLTSKKELLSSEINLLNIVRRLKNYRVLRRKEMASKNSLNREMKALRTKFGLLEASFPNQKELKVKDDKRKNKVKKGKVSKADVHDELDEIRKKLERLEGK
ncbi:hypothetical protein CMI38_02210 [Candidatus Pacearchaeota archaeon]|jgi:hypothetical protein|nr:hypothetical protein [Candidatus Pacearchaeota archaeon]|tara:strand:+ start:2457 stop:2798 length:342 start_codon:yes stop_codon:yes gene_type:complete